MTLNIQHDTITGTFTSHTARRLPGDRGLWEVSWLPGQSMDRTHAVAAMGLADVTRAEEHTGHLDRDLIDSVAHILPDLNDRSLTPSPAAEPEPGKDGQLSDPEAGG